MPGFILICAVKEKPQCNTDNITICNRNVNYFTVPNIYKVMKNK